MTTPAHGTHTPGALTSALIWLSRNTPMGRGQARKLISGAVRSNHKGPLDTEMWGQKVRVNFTHNNSELKALLNPSRYSKREFAFIREVLPREGAVFLDVGANVGMFSVYAQSQMTDGILIAFEPQPDLFKRMTFNLNANAKPGVAVHPVQAALGAEAGTIQLHVPEEKGNATLADIDAAGGEMIDVKLVPLKDGLQQAGISAVDVMKIDVEGYEDRVLVPFFETAPETLWPKAILMEHCHSGRWDTDCLKLLAGLGYKTAYRTNGNIALKRG